jgi:ADP-heptose:LPS heptosyltransferase
MEVLFKISSARHSRKPVKFLVGKVNQLGDNIVFLPIVQQLVKDFGYGQLLVLTSPKASQLYNSFLPPEHIISCPTNKFNSAWKHPAFLFDTIRKVRKFAPTVAILAQDQGNIGHLVSLLSGAKVRYGSPRPFIRIRNGITHPVEVPDGISHALWGWKILATFYEDIQMPLPALPPPPNLPLQSKAIGKVDFTIHAGGSLQHKRWHSERYVQLANLLSNEYSVRWIETPEVESDGLGPQIERAVTPTIGDLVSSLNESRVFVGNNSGPMNICSALGTPGVIFCGPSPKSWDPYWHRDRFLILRDESLPCICCEPETGPLDRCINFRYPMACMDLWTTNAVLEYCRQWHSRAIQKFP